MCFCISPFSGVFFKHCGKQRYLKALKKDYFGVVEFWHKKASHSKLKNK
jgi:hypothetical protein